MDRDIKATELMLGDWVQCTYWHNPHILQVYELKRVGDDELKIVVVEDALPLVFQEVYIEPIPLTAEILENNGFRIDKNESYCERYFFATNLGRIPQTVVELTFYGEGVDADTLFECWTKPECDGENRIHICDLKYVHQLQHALRLCGIDKEIVL